MAPTTTGIVLFGDVVRSRRDTSVSTAWLHSLCDELDARYGKQALAPFDFVQGDELQGLLAPTADPFDVVLTAALDDDHVPMRWVVCLGRIDAGTGPATRRTGDAFVTARETIKLARMRRDDLVVRTGDPDCDLLLGDVTPVLGELLRELSGKQRRLARLALVEGHRPTQIAALLGVSRATVSVGSRRARVRSIARLLAVSRRAFRSGVAAAGPDGDGQAPRT